MLSGMVMIELNTEHYDDDQCFLRCFEGPMRSLKCYQRPLKIQYKLALLPPSKCIKTLLCHHLSIQMK